MIDECEHIWSKEDLYRADGKRIGSVRILRSPNYDVKTLFGNESAIKFLFDRDV